jgi:hypothetical protein
MSVPVSARIFTALGLLLVSLLVSAAIAWIQASRGPSFESESRALREAMTNTHRLSLAGHDVFRGDPQARSRFDESRQRLAQSVQALPDWQPVAAGTAPSDRSEASLGQAWALADAAALALAGEADPVKVGSLDRLTTALGALAEQFDERQQQIAASMASTVTPLAVGVSLASLLALLVFLRRLAPVSSPPLVEEPVAVPDLIPEPVPDPQVAAAAARVIEAWSPARETALALLRSSERLSEEIADTGEAVLGMAQQIDTVSARAAEAASVARLGLAAAQQGSRAVDNSISGMNGIRDQIQDTARRIKRLGESSQEIGEIVSVISDLTDRTNVLALNAAIQAASAGEAGRGFTLVAEEVQRLAERSGEAARQVAALISAIQSDTREALESMERTTVGVVAGTRLADEAGQALTQIGEVSTRLAGLIDEFSSSTSRQAAQAGALAQAIRGILRGAERDRSSTIGTERHFADLSGLVGELEQSVGGSGPGQGPRK